MSAKKLVRTLIELHASDDELITLNRVLYGLYEMKVDCDCKQVRRAITITESTINNKLKQLK
jgi:hypothetical protein